MAPSRLRRLLWRMGIRLWYYDGVRSLNVWGWQVLPTAATRRRAWPDEDAEARDGDTGDEPC